MSGGRIHQLNVSDGGVPKRPVETATVDVNGITVDHQSDRKAHGGPLRALCMYSAERLGELATEGHNLNPGYLGENVTIEGLDWSLVVPGVLVNLGPEVRCEVTSYTTPCWKNARWFIDGDFSRILQDKHPGYSRVYARVIQGGSIARGDTVELIRETAAERVRRRQPNTYRWSPPGS
jgi:MOSC domain-containing protein YiiM